MKSLFAQRFYQVTVILLIVAVSFASTLLPVQASPQVQSAISGVLINQIQSSGINGPSDEFISLFNTSTSTPTSTATSTHTATSTPSPTSTSCFGWYSSLSLVINEVGWMGTQANSNDEWVEFYNTTACPIPLSDWTFTIEDTSTDIGLAGTISPHSYFLLADNKDVFKNITIDQVSSALNLTNDGESLRLTSPTGSIIDTANWWDGYWPAGIASDSNSNRAYTSMERYYPPGASIPPSDNTTAWVTYAGTLTGVALDRNGNHVHGTPRQKNWASTVTETPAPTATYTRTPSPTTTVLDDNSYAITYQGWVGRSDASASGGGYRYSNSAGQTISYITTFNAASFTLVTYKGPDQGKVQIFVDNISKGVFDLYNPVPLYKYSISFNGLVNKTHTVTITVLGQKNALSKGFQVRVDALKFGTWNIEDNNVAISYGSWRGTFTTSSYGGSYRSSNITNMPITFSVTGSQFLLITARGKNYGFIDVYVDGSYLCTYNLYSPTQQWQYQIIISGLGSGVHVVTIRVNGFRDPSSTSATVIFDAAVYPSTVTVTLTPTSTP